MHTLVILTFLSATASALPNLSIQAQNTSTTNSTAHSLVKREHGWIALFGADDQYCQGASSNKMDISVDNCYQWWVDDETLTVGKLHPFVTIALLTNPTTIITY